MDAIDPPDPMGFVSVDCERLPDELMGRKGVPALGEACMEIKREFAQARDWGRRHGLRCVRPFLFGHPWVLPTDAPEAIVVALKRFLKSTTLSAWCLNCYHGEESRADVVNRANRNRTAIDWVGNRNLPIIAAVGVVTHWQPRERTRMLSGEELETVAMAVATTRAKVTWLWTSHRPKVERACWLDHPVPEVQANIVENREAIRSCYGVEPAVGDVARTMAEVDAMVLSSWERLRRSIDRLTR